ncbi:hypothetical protein MMU07_13760 [Aquiflexum sp. LQ15W]|uniref:hypothetical protein n=1 Tax=Cognataquiflexum nitidum TaxID=2922272 RepID=UPI001F12D387|nr:hypothetical protein [Cognataquiflexum nitidum]MCH6200646.1 hypothetical protein [Cognataquiflexum nitidum]
MVIITTFEILPVAILGKWLIGYKLIYDRRENYILNLEQNKTLKGWKKKLSKGLVSFIEYCSNPFIDHNFFAEKVYQKEFPKVGKHTIFQNKYFDRGNDIKPIKLNANKKLRFIISGTITEVYGIIEGVSWFQSIIAYYPSAILTVIGHAPMKEYLQKISKINIDPRSIRLQISEIPVPYSDILEAYQETEIVLLPYHQIPSISPKIPSKLYESIALGKPCLFQHNQLWESICSEYPAGKGIDFLDIENAKSNLDKFLQTIFFEKKPGEEVLWKSDEAKFLEVVARLTNKL